jgi:hypothetical protein
MASEGFMGGMPPGIPPRAGIAGGIAPAALMGEPIMPPSAFLATLPPFLSFSSTEGSVVSILTIGLN